MESSNQENPTNINNQTSQEGTYDSSITNETNNSSNYSLLTYVIIGLVFLVLISGILYLLLSEKTEGTVTQTKPTEITETQTGDTLANVLEEAFTDIDNKYSGNIPWDNINNKESYQFFPLRIEDFTLTGTEISVSYDHDYNQLTEIELGNHIVPLKTSYAGYYEIPREMSGRYGIGAFDIVFPIELALYEFNREPNESEYSILRSGELYKCSNEQSEVSFHSLTRDQVIMHYCDMNLTSEQKETIGEENFYDIGAGIYFAKRNILLDLKFNSRYIDQPQDYISDYLSKVLIPNDDLFVTQKQIQTVQEAREFDEWIRSTFGD